MDEKWDSNSIEKRLIDWNVAVMHVDGAEAVDSLVVMVTAEAGSI